MRQHSYPSVAVLCLAVLLSACGSGSGSGSGEAGSGPSHSPSGSGSLLVRVIDELGAPVQAAHVSIVRSRDGAAVAEKLTDSRGEASFASLPAGTLQMDVHSRDHQYPAATTLEIKRRMDLRSEVTLKARPAATTVVLGTRKVGTGEDGRTLHIETDIAVLAATGDPLVSLPDSAFELGQWDCGWGGCITGPDGREVGGWTVQTTRPEKFDLVPGKARSPFAVGFLLDLGDGVQAEGEEPRRSEALVEFLQEFGGNDRALLASFGSRSDESAIHPSGEFANDGRSLVPVAQDLPNRIEGQSSLADAVKPMLDYLQEHSSALPTTMVVVGGLGPRCGGWSQSSCQQLAEHSRVAGIPIVTMMGHHNGAADLAHLTGGAYFTVGFPAQYRTALRGLSAVLGGEIAFYRLRYTLRLDHADMLAPGNMLHTSIRVTLSEGHDVHAPITLAL